MKRKTLPKEIQAEVLTLSRRRCAICFGIERDIRVKKGQIAHLDKNRENSSLDNLAFLCQEHHDEYDRISRQTKGYQEREVKQYRDELYKWWCIEEANRSQKKSKSKSAPSAVTLEEPGPYPAVAAGLLKIDGKLPCCDGYLEVCRSPAWRGWPENLVEIQEMGDYDPPPEMTRLLELYPVSGGSKPRYGLRSVVRNPLIDDLSPLRLSLLRGWYHFVNALTEESAKPDASKRAFRRWAEENWWPLETSRVWHNVNCQAVVITSDKKLILLKRSDDVHIYQGCWSATLEEQMLRPHATSSGDQTLFECAHRGVFEELGVDVIPNRTRLISVGLEWLNFSASFLFVVHTDARADEAVWLWLQKAPDPYEASAMDFVAANTQDLGLAVQSAEWRPTNQVISRAGKVMNLTASWHPTARARLLSCARHFSRDIVKSCV